MTTGFDTIVDNDALRVLDLRLADGVTAPLKVAHERAVLVGMDDGGGYAVTQNGAAPRYLPIARGRVDWLGHGVLEIHRGQAPFGRAVLIDVKALPDAGGVSRTFGDRVLATHGDACVYEEIIGPSQVRRMHNHGPRLVLCLSDIDLRNTLPDGSKVDVKRKAGAVTWNAAVVTHEVFNVADAPFWCVCVEHA